MPHQTVHSDKSPSSQDTSDRTGLSPLHTARRKQELGWKPDWLVRLIFRNWRYRLQTDYRNRCGSCCTKCTFMINGLKSTLLTLTRMIGEPKRNLYLHRSLSSIGPLLRIILCYGARALFATILTCTHLQNCRIFRLLSLPYISLVRGLYRSYIQSHNTFERCMLGIQRIPIPVNHRSVAFPASEL